MMEIRLQTLVLATALIVMMGWLVFIGQAILMPIVAGLISATVLFSATDALQRVPIVGAAPPWVRRLLVLLGFVAVVALLALIMVSNVQRVIAALPDYQDNLISAISSASRFAGLNTVPNWEHIREVTIGRIDLQRFIMTLLSSTTSLGGQIFLIVLYAAFLLAERIQFSEKLVRAMATEESAHQILTIFIKVNQRIGDYLAVKTLVNAILGLISFVIMWLIGIHFALFWAILIGLLNYIPYFGSLLGVLFPVVLSLAQSGSWQMAFWSLITLTAAQMYVGNFLEPRMIGRSVNLSPFVVLVALSIWTTLWGLPGAILAIPMTAGVVSILAEIPSTRPFAIMLSSDGGVVLDTDNDS